MAAFQERYLAIVSEYLTNLSQTEQSRDGYQLLQLLLRRVQTSQLLSLHAQILLGLNQKAQAAAQFKLALDHSLRGGDIAQNKAIRLRFGRFLEEQDGVGIQRVLGVFFPGVVFDCFEPAQDGAATRRVRAVRRTLFPTLQSQFVRYFSIAEVYTTREQDEELLGLSADLYTDLPLRAEAAMAVYNSHEFAGDGMAGLAAVVVRLAWVPLQAALLGLLLARNKRRSACLSQIDQTLSQAIGCKRGDTSCRVCCDAAREFVFQDRSVASADGRTYTTAQMEQLAAILDKANLVKLAMFYIQNAPAVLAADNHCQLCIDSNLLLVVYIVVNLHQRNVFRLTDQYFNQLSAMQLDLAIRTHNNDLSYQPILRQCQRNLSNEKLVFQLVQVSL